MKVSLSALGVGEAWHLRNGVRLSSSDTLDQMRLSSVHPAENRKDIVFTHVSVPTGEGGAPHLIEYECLPMESAGEAGELAAHFRRVCGVFQRHVKLSPDKPMRGYRAEAELPRVSRPAESALRM